MLIEVKYRALLQSYMDWVDNGAPDYSPYSRGTGLCSNLYAETDFETYEYFKHRLTVWAKLNGTEATYPFSDWPDYLDRTQDRSQHTLQPRLDWIKAELERLA